MFVTPFGFPIREARAAPDAAELADCCDRRQEYERGDRQGDGGAKVDDGRAVETSSGEGPDRARQRQRRVASAGLNAEEIADLLAPCSAPQCERWIKPFVVYDFRQRVRKEDMTLSANAQRMGEDIILLAGLSGPRSPSNRGGDLLAWSTPPEVGARRQFTARRSDI